MFRKKLNERKRAKLGVGFKSGSNLYIVLERTEILKLFNELYDVIKSRKKDYFFRTSEGDKLLIKLNNIQYLFLDLNYF